MTPGPRSPPFRRRPPFDSDSGRRPVVAVADSIIGIVLTIVIVAIAAAVVAATVVAAAVAAVVAIIVAVVVVASEEVQRIVFAVHGPGPAVAAAPAHLRDSTCQGQYM